MDMMHETYQSGVEDILRAFLRVTPLAVFRAPSYREPYDDTSIVSASRHRILREIVKIRQERRDKIPDHLEESVQNCFDLYCIDSAKFCGTLEWALFCRPEGANAGTWGMRLRAAVPWIRCRIPAANDLTLQDIGL